MIAMFPKPIPVALISPLAQDECVARLSAAIDHENLAESIQIIKPFFLGSKSVSGRVSKNCVRLRRQFRWRNAVQHILLGTFQSTAHGTVFNGTLGIHTVIRILIVTACLVGSAIFGVSVLALVVGSASRDLAIVGALLTPFAVGCLMLSVKVSRFSAEEEKQYLTRFLEDVLSSREIPKPEGLPE